MLFKRGFKTFYNNMATCITLSINASDRASYRRQLISEFLKEQPGTTNSVTEYYYYVDVLQNGNRIYLKRPTALNKGVDFEVRVENTQFRYGVHNNVISTGNRYIFRSMFGQREMLK